MRRRLLATTATPTNNSKRSRPSSRQRFMPPAEEDGDAALDPSAETLSLLEGAALLVSFPLQSFLPPRWGMQGSRTPACWQAC